VTREYDDLRRCVRSLTDLELDETLAVAGEADRIDGLPSTRRAAWS
jgi:hypothetical protein